MTGKNRIMKTARMRPALPAGASLRVEPMHLGVAEATG
jgi:hypothetical protein